MIYRSSREYLRSAFQDAGKILMRTCGKDDGQKNILRKVKEYLDRADELEAQINEEKSKETRPQHVPEALDLNMAQFMLVQALELDNNDEIDEALALYGENYSRMFHLSRDLIALLMMGTTEDFLDVVTILSSLHQEKRLNCAFWQNP